jgi:hypothetical protein
MKIKPSLIKKTIFEAAGGTFPKKLQHLKPL